MSKPLKVFWMSNSPHATTGYGNQTYLFAKALQKRGHEVLTRGFWGHNQAIINHEGITVFPATYDELAQDSLASDFLRHEPDVFVILYDAWAYKPDILEQIPLTFYAPIDHQPAPPQVIDRLTHCKWVWAMSRFGEGEMRQAGLDPFYVPHMVDTDVYTPLDREGCRQKWGVAPGRFLVAVNAANKGYPSRKNLDKILKAWSLFVQTHPDAMLYMHTGAQPVHNGYNLVKMVDFYGIPENTIRFPDQHKFRDGEITDGMLNAMYNAADVFLLPSQGEGFGIPVIQAQAAGCPIIVADFSAQRELCGAGYKIPVDRIDDLYYTVQGSEQAWIRPSAIITALEWAYEQRGNTALRTQAREFAMGYSVDTVTDRHMLPAMITMAQGNADWKRERGIGRKSVVQAPAVPTGKGTAENPECNANGHDWLQTAIIDGDWLCAPCRRKGCEAELRESRNGQIAINEHGFKSTVNGVTLDIEDDPQGGVAKIILREIEKHYDLDSIPFEPGDKVIDIGAQVGIVSMYLAKKHPQITVYAYEPLPENYNRLCRNLKANNIENVKAYTFAVSGDSRPLELHGDPTVNSGGASAFIRNGTKGGYKVQSVTLKEIFEWNKIDRCKLLKIDCEGAEYEILGKAPLALLKQIDYVRGEFHVNGTLRQMDYQPEKLYETLTQIIGEDRVKANVCEMAA